MKRVWLILAFCLCLLSPSGATQVFFPVTPQVFWTPLNGSNLNVWWDAQNTSKFVLSGSNVTSWTDSSANAVVATGVASPVYTTHIIHGESVVAFNGSSQYFTSTLSASAVPFTTVAVIQVDNSGFVRTITGASVNGGFEFRVSTTNTLVLNLQQTTLVCTSTGTITTSVPAVVSVSFDGTNCSFTINGSAAGSSTNTQTATSSTIRIGANTFGSDYFYQYMGDIIQFGAISTSELNKSIGYLAWKYGLQGSLPGTFPYAARPPYVNDP